MRRVVLAMMVALVVLLPAATEARASTARSTSPKPKAGAGFVEETIQVPIFGKVSVYRPEPIQKTRGVVLFLSGDGGWNKGVVDMARRAAPEALVVGLSLPLYQKIAVKSPSKCWYPGGELEQIAQAVEKIYHVPRYLKPILIGYSSGATLVYGVLAQSPVASFTGAISMGFCDDLDVARPFCGSGEWKPSYNEKKHLSLLPPNDDLAPSGAKPRWIAFQGESDQVCDPNAVRTFVEKVPGARLVSLPKVGHGFSVPRNWGTAFDDAVGGFLEPASAWAPEAPAARAPAQGATQESIAASLEPLGLPLVVSWPEGARAAVLFVSGDGGWADLDQQVMTRLTASGVAVVGWNALRYFWQAKSPETFESDLGRVVGALPEGTPIYAGGYSFGAEVIAVTLDAGRGRNDPLSRIRGLVLLAPGLYASFEVSPLDWIRTSHEATDYPVRAKLQGDRSLPALCIDASSDASDSGCPRDPCPNVVTATLPGSHHFGGDYGSLAERILKFIESPGGSTAASASRSGV